MNTREYFVQCFKSEVPRFVRVLKAVPAGGGGIPPAPALDVGRRDRVAARERAEGRVRRPRQGRGGLRPAPGARRRRGRVKAYEKNAAALKRRLAKVKDAAWRKKARFLVDGKVAWETPLGDMLWGFLFDAIHHRGQLSTYLRPMGAKVPSIYGPSADDPGM